MTSQPKVHIPTALAQITKHWSPKLVANLNSSHDVKIATIAGEFIWHSHPATDELFYVLGGSLTLEMERPYHDVAMTAGDMFVVPKGVRHRPVSAGAEIMLIEAVGTVNTGDGETAHPEMTAAVEDARQ